MTGFPLKIVTPDGLFFDGTVEMLIVRATTGDMAVLAGHTDCVVPLGMGKAVVVVDGERRTAACIGGILSMLGGTATLVPTTFEWSDQIDIARADASMQRAQSVLENKSASDTDIRLAEARLKRALVRKGVAARK